MSRPLSGSIQLTPAGGFAASLPKVRGQRARQNYTFKTRADARRWVGQGVAALEAGRPLPVPPAADLSGYTRPAPAAAGTCFGTVGQAYVHERYVEDGHGEFDRETQIRGYIDAIDAYMREHSLHVETITRKNAREMYRYLLKDTAPPVAVPVPTAEDPEAEVTMAEGRTILDAAGHPVSERRFKTARRAGALEPVGSRGQAHLYRLGDLFDPAAGLVRERTAAGGRYSHSTLREVRRTFRAVLDYAESEGVPLQPQVRAAEPPRDRAPKVKKRAMTLGETARVAAHLHVVHQVVLLLLRLLGLRVSEAYGLLVEDVVDTGLGRHGLLIVQSQGGKTFRKRGPDGQAQTSNHIDSTKKDWRVLVVPAPLMDLIRIVLDVFHTDEDGALRTDARLVPGLKKDDVGGQSAFRNALTNAAAAVGLNVVFDEVSLRSQRGLVQVTPTPQTMRQSFATALQADRAEVENIRAFMGHRRGAEVIHEHYLLEDGQLKPQRDIAEALAAQIATDLPDGLMIRTAISCTTGRQRAIARRRNEIDAKLIDLGWYVHAGCEGDWITVADAAGLRGVTEAQIREDIDAGHLSAIKVARSDQGGMQYLVQTEDVLARTERLAFGSGMRQLADEVGVPYDKVRQYIRRHPDLDCEPLGRRDYRVPGHVAGHVRDYFAEQKALANRAVRLTDVAGELGMSVAAVGTLIKHGVLTEDVRFHGGIRSITTASLDTYRRRGARRRRRQTP